ncbi:hypothetical protein JL722_9684 [Aureococcus anophagefferens]|nr:hypothetical protein JL722_9684 [Aureococcus anophagefferens]
MSSLSASAEAGASAEPLISATRQHQNIGTETNHPQKLRLLCLHGYAQNANFFSSRTGAVRKGIKALADVHYLGRAAAGDRRVPRRHRRGRARAPGLVEHARRRAARALGAYVGLDESVARVKRCVAGDGPSTASSASQEGAALAALLCLSEPGLFGFALLFAGFVPRDAIVRAPFDAAAAAPNATPTFHCLGASDASVPPDVARSLASCFASPAVFEHAGGHVVPGNAPLRNAVKDFRAAMISTRPA